MNVPGSAHLPRPPSGRTLPPRRQTHAVKSNSDPHAKPLDVTDASLIAAAAATVSARVAAQTARR